jgi:glycosyltransferase involved in cell wall biosynthesis
MDPRSNRSQPRGGAMPVHSSRPVRLLTLTTLFPNVRQPRHGIFVANRLRRLCDTGRVEATVVAAVPWFPGAYRDRARIPDTENIAGFNVRHPRYLNIPRVGMRIQPDTLARALLDEVRRGTIGAQFDAIDAHYFYPDGVAAVRVADALGLPLVISARGSDINLIGDIPFARQRMLDAAKRAQALIAVSAALTQKMAALGMPVERMHVLRNGVDMEQFAPFSRREARKRLNLPEDGRLVLAVGNLVAEKGIDLVVRAVSALENVRLLVVGEGPLRDDLTSLGRSIAPGRIEFRRNVPQDELRYVYAAADVLALASLREGWPNVILEAIACGTPVVAAAVGGVPEMLGKDAPARLVMNRSTEAWSEALRSVLEASFAPERVRQYAVRFGWDEVVSQQCALYQDVASAHNEEVRRRSA